jgi:hypothetical protein
MNIPQVEHGGNGESAGVVNQWLLSQPVESRGFAALAPSRRLGALAFSRICCTESSVGSDLRSAKEILLTVQRGGRSVPAGAQRTFAMFETVTAFLGLVSVGIFAAHAFEGFRSRA